MTKHTDNGNYDILANWKNWVDMNIHKEVLNATVDKNGQDEHWGDEHWGDESLV